MLRRTSRHRPARTCRRGVAAVELAVVFLFFMIPMMIGIWEVGRLIQVQQIVSNSAREGARVAAQGYTIDPDDGTTIEIRSSTGDVNIKDVVFQYLRAAGLDRLDPADVQTTFAFSAPNSSGATDPYQGVKNQPFTVTVTITAWDKVRWVNLGLINPTQVTFTVSWQMLVDDPFQVNTTLPNF